VRLVGIAATVGVGAVTLVESENEISVAFELIESIGIATLLVLQTLVTAQTHIQSVRQTDSLILNVILQPVPC